MKRTLSKLWLCAVVVFISACSFRSDVDVPSSMYGDIAGPDFYGGESGKGAGDENENGQQNEYAGKVTAGEWRDLDHWDLWSELMTNPNYGRQEGQQEEPVTENYYGYPDNYNPYDFTLYSDYWRLYTNNRVAVRVRNNAGEPVADVSVKLLRGNAGDDGVVLYTGRTDNNGEVNLWAGLTQRLDNVGSGLLLHADGVPPLTNVTVTGWGSEVVWNEMTTTEASAEKMDIAFIVDATGSMSDEINFLKADLQSIIHRVQQEHSDAALRTGALFYRDEGDEYVTKANDFTSSLTSTINFIDKQCADGGGNYPEAVHTALEKGLQDLSWNEEHCIRLAFMLLDAPPHHEDKVIISLQQIIPLYAAKGIRIIPVAASGVDKPTEFFLRFAAMATDGTYVFLTNDSGVGGDHIKATVGDYEVELLSDLIVRLINQYLE